MRFDYLWMTRPRACLFFKRKKRKSAQSFLWNSYVHIIGSHLRFVIFDAGGSACTHSL
ncbi:hypothetical protein HOLleu_11770 [Holothuria leucospilota]|uniref:Uncharacterized protein n=1 Tax=Holothuria leucospilota TaxID=206669 RepID=A0A9Q1C9W6_HOLLE|nr:hypothetical protein HOLleu_11770 [Holothuria leucospilota]